MTRVDIAVVGAGMAGASLAAVLTRDARVALLEAEAQPGIHATGRSAAFWSETYGGPHVQPLTTASHSFLAVPEPAFSDRPFLSPRGELHIAGPGRAAALDGLEREFAGTVPMRRLDGAALDAIVPGLRPGWRDALHEPRCADIDVAGLHAAYLRAFRRNGGVLLLEAGLDAASRDAARWRLRCGAHEIEADVLVNAAGAWADAVARIAGARPIGVRAYRRTMVQLAVEPAVPANLPLVIDLDGGFYFKGEGLGRVWLSPHDETESPAGDVAPEELDIAVAIDRLQQVVDWEVRRVERAWAGLRSFAADRLPVYGFDPRMSGFFWCAGQGGWGIQTAPAAADLAARLVLGREPGAVDPAPYFPSRF